jgi:hypothetical protein
MVLNQQLPPLALNAPPPEASLSEASFLEASRPEAPPPKAPLRPLSRNEAPFPKEPSKRSTLSRNQARNRARQSWAALRAGLRFSRTFKIASEKRKEREKRLSLLKEFKKLRPLSKAEIIEEQNLERLLQEPNKLAQQSSSISRTAVNRKGKKQIVETNNRENGNGNNNNSNNNENKNRPRK